MKMNETTIELFGYTKVQGTDFVYIRQVRKQGVTNYLSVIILDDAGEEVFSFEIPNSQLADMIGYYDDTFDEEDASIDIGACIADAIGKVTSKDLDN